MAHRSYTHKHKPTRNTDRYNKNTNRQKYIQAPTLERKTDRTRRKITTTLHRRYNYWFTSQQRVRQFQTSPNSWLVWHSHTGSLPFSSVGQVSAFMLLAHDGALPGCKIVKSSRILRRSSTRAGFCSKDVPNFGDISLEANQNLFRKVLHKFNPAWPSLGISRKVLHLS